VKAAFIKLLIYDAAMTDQDIKNELSRLDRDALYVIAKRLNLKSFKSKPSKDRLVDLILYNSTPEQIRAIQLLPSPPEKRVLDNSKERRLFKFHTVKETVVFLAGVAAIVGLPLAIWQLVKTPSPVVVVTPSDINKSATDSVRTNQNDFKSTPQTSEAAAGSPSPALTPRLPKQSTSRPASRTRANGSDTSSLLNRARQLYNQRKYWDARNLCDKVLSTEPNNAEALSLKNQINHTINTLNN
jgi:hypothetical protein